MQLIAAYPVFSWATGLKHPLYHWVASERKHCRKQKISWHAFRLHLYKVIDDPPISKLAQWRVGTRSNPRTKAFSAQAHTPVEGEFDCRRERLFCFLFFELLEKPHGRFLESQAQPPPYAANWCHWRSRLVPRPVQLAQDVRYTTYRKAVIDFLYTRQAHVEKLTA